MDDNILLLDMISIRENSMKIYNVIIVFIVGLMLSACGGGGGGATPTAVTQTYTSLYVEGGGEAGVASVEGVDAAAVYTYNFKGTDVDVTLSGISAGTFYTSTEGAISKHIGGTTYSYSRFGVVAAYYSYGGSSITPAATAPLYVDGEVFYVGQKTSSMPTTGTASYSGYLTTLSITGQFEDAPIGFDVNYGDKKIEGSLKEPGSSLFGETISFDGTIDGSDFSGTATSSSWNNSGTFSGSFFGPNAEELGGVGMFSDSVEGALGFSFGAKKEEL